MRQENAKIETVIGISDWETPALGNLWQARTMRGHPREQLQLQMRLDKMEKATRWPSDRGEWKKEAYVLLSLSLVVSG